MHKLRNKCTEDTDLYTKHHTLGSEANEVKHSRHIMNSVEFHNIKKLINVINRIN